MSKISIPKSGFKRVANAVKDIGYTLSTNVKSALAPFFNKNGTLKKSALRSNKQRAKFKEELQKAKQEIKEEQKQRREERERKKEERKRERKRKKQRKTYEETGHEYDTSTYDDFIDILDDVYDEVNLYFYDSDQIMQWLDSEELTKEDIKQLLVTLNKNKEMELTETEKKLLSNSNYHISDFEKNKMYNVISEVILLSSKSDLTPQTWLQMKINSPFEYEEGKRLILGD